MLVYWPGWFCESGDREVAAGHGGVQRVDEWGGLPHRGWGKEGLHLSNTMIVVMFM